MLLFPSQPHRIQIDLHDVPCHRIVVLCRSVRHEATLIRFSQVKCSESGGLSSTLNVSLPSPGYTSPLAFSAWRKCRHEGCPVLWAVVAGVPKGAMVFSTQSASYMKLKVVAILVTSHPISSHTSLNNTRFRNHAE